MSALSTPPAGNGARPAGAPGTRPAASGNRSVGSGTRPAGYAVVRGRKSSWLVHRRGAAVAVVLAVALFAAVVANLTLGETTVSPTEVVKVLFGRPSPTNWSSARCGRPAWSSG